jgi:hypothetical protein
VPSTCGIGILKLETTFCLLRPERQVLDKDFHLLGLAVLRIDAGFHVEVACAIVMPGEHERSIDVNRHQPGLRIMDNVQVEPLVVQVAGELLAAVQMQ